MKLYMYMNVYTCEYPYMLMFKAMIHRKNNRNNSSTHHHEYLKQNVM